MATSQGVTIDAEIFLHRITTLSRTRLDKPVALALVDTAKSAISKAGSLTVWSWETAASRPASFRR